MFIIGLILANGGGYREPFQVLFWGFPALILVATLLRNGQIGGHVSIAEMVAPFLSAVPRLSVLVGVGDDVLFARNPDYEHCSCSTFKMAATTAVLTLVERGRVDLDTPVVDLAPYVSFSSEIGAMVTLRMLLSHTSGLDDTDDVEEDPVRVTRHLPFVAKPDRAFRYSNVGFDLGCHVAAAVAGCDYATLVTDQVLDPLGMAGTHFSDKFPLSCPATTVRDLGALAREQLGGERVLRGETLAEMHRVHADSYTAAPARYYGLGIVVETWEGRTLLSHGGGLGTYGSALLIDPSAGAWVAVLFDHPAGYGLSAHRLLYQATSRMSKPYSVQARSVDYRPYLGKYDNGAILAEESGRPRLIWNGRTQGMEPVDERLFAGGGLSLGLLPGEPKMISVNDFILIGARPGTLLQPPR